MSFHNYNFFSSVFIPKLISQAFIIFLSVCCMSLEYEYAYQMVVREPKSPDSDDHSVGSTLGGFFDYHADEPPEFIAERNAPPHVP